MFATPKRPRAPGGPAFVTPPTAESASPARSPVTPSPEKDQTEMLAKQVAHLRQREAAQAAELDRLRRLMGDSQMPRGSTFQTPPKSLGGSTTRNDFMDEVERLRRENRELTVTNYELQIQIQDAASSIEGFSTAIEKVESSYEQKEATWKRQVATLQAECKAQEEASRAIRRDYEAELKAKEETIDDLRSRAVSAQTARDTTSSTLQSKESLLASLSSELDQMRAERTELEAAARAHEADAATWRAKTDEAAKTVESLTLRLQQAQAATSASGQSILVKTLREEIRLLRGQLEAQFKKDKDTLLQRVATLQTQLAESQRTSADKDRSLFALNAKLEDAARAQQALAHTNTQLEATVARLTKDVAKAQDDLVQLQQCRGFLGHHLDEGFQELFRDDDALATAQAELSTVRAECANLQRQVELKAVWQNQVRELETQLAAQERELAAGRDATRQLAQLEANHREAMSSVATLTDANRALREQVAAASELPALQQQCADNRATIAKLESDLVKRKASESKLRALLDRQQRAAEQTSALDGRLADVLAEAKKDRTDIVALRAMVQTAKQKIARYEAERTQFKELETKYRDARTMAHVLKKELAAQQAQVRTLQAQGSSSHDAQLQHMQRVVEAHTKELVAEIEALQKQYQSQLHKYKRAKKDKELVELQLRDRNAYIATLEVQARRPSLRTKAPVVVVDPPLKLKELQANPADEMESILTTLERISDKYR
ncbi:hypothetical protein ACHHYP_13250 [Achlya hypogyna]|uniref:Uncharacterized protein n=1 Tax=Achlya hypogyna TaxID=1202772 RepID=A0A1V9YFN2_ACHHY|nr:hypothetical protein ACHHYP_13250 [Achlya hypogyna]